MSIQTPKNDDKINARFLLSYPNRSCSEDNAFCLDIDTQLPNHGITAIFGESGSGKTSLLRCIAGLEHAKQSSLSVNGEIWQNDSIFLPTHKRPIAYVFQEASLFPHLSAQDNLAYAVKRSTGVTQAVYEQVLTIMGIKPILQRHPEQLSGGERQRVAIARALLIQPQLLLMDEPLASLDARRKQEILPYLEQLRATFNIPILYVSHALDEIARLADHIVLMDQGKVTTQGSLNTVLSRVDLPVDLGDDTGVILHGKIVERDVQWKLIKIALEEGELWVNDSGGDIGQLLRLRILAKDVSLALSSHEDSSILNRLSVEVVEISTKQNSGISLVRLQLGSQFLIAQLTQKSVHQLQLKLGKRVWAQIKSVAIIH